ncbi:MAG: flagellar hook capping FlgD N-terminal domain-containing protein [Clostridia bacterium]|jgi:flagellar basal-body rod modification protein FlgD
MNIIPIGQTTEYVNNAKAEDATTMDQEDFLQILVSQMQNQNPMEPMDDFEYMSQITQFSMLDSVDGIYSQISGLKALDYIGKNVIGSYMNDSSTTTQYIEGLVQSITIQDDSVILNLEDGSLYMDNVLNVYE